MPDLFRVDHRPRGGHEWHACPAHPRHVAESIEAAIRQADPTRETRIVRHHSEGLMSDPEPKYLRMHGHAQAWQKVWREGVSPLLSVSCLEVLRTGLVSNDPRIIQRQTIRPANTQAAALEAVEASDPIAFALWQGEQLRTVGQVEARWVQVCSSANRPKLPATLLLYWWDDTPRPEAVRLLLREVTWTLARRNRPEGASSA